MLIAGGVCGSPDHPHLASPLAYLDASISYYTNQLSTVENHWNHVELGAGTLDLS